MQDLRKLERFDLKLPARINVLPPGGETLDLITENICAGGAFFPTRTPLSEGIKVLVDLVIRSERSRSKPSIVTVAGKVLRSEQGGMAILFDKKYHISPIL
jgi:hypothetical protein